jgi:hypothetical protein
MHMLMHIYIYIYDAMESSRTTMSTARYDYDDHDDDDYDDVDDDVYLIEI